MGVATVNAVYDTYVNKFSGPYAGSEEMMVSGNNSDVYKRQQITPIPELSKTVVCRCGTASIAI